MVLAPSGKFCAVPLSKAGEYEAIARPATRFLTPAHWKSSVCMNPHADDAQTALCAWMTALGCTPGELKLVAASRAAEYVGLAFPEINQLKTVSLSKYLSMWLLWDDLQIEVLKAQWQLSMSGERDLRLFPALSRYDRGWANLLAEYAVNRSPAWMRRLCLDMEHWTNIATEEAQVVSRYQRDAMLPSFEEQLELRIVTIGMYPTAYLIEDALNWEFCDDFHAGTRIKTIKRLAGLMVGIGNDIFSLGKDLHENNINLVVTLADERDITARDAMDYLIRLHNDAVLEFDALAAEELAHGSEAPDRLSSWLSFLRYSCAGFTHWESRAERYTEYCVLYQGRIQAIDYP